jgi:hypothetical protein
MAVVTALFFMWGFVTCLNDILIPHLKSIFDLNYAEVMLVQFAFFSSYFVFSFPAGKIIDYFGYSKAMVTGLVTMGIGAIAFVPAARVPSFPLFLAAAGDRVEPLKSRAGLQLSRNDARSVVRQPLDPWWSGGRSGRRSIEDLFSAAIAGVSRITGVIGKNALHHHLDHAVRAGPHPRLLSPSGHSPGGGTWRSA